MLGSCEYGKPVDMWAIGCIMGEIIDGQPLFPGESEIDQLYLIQKVLGSLTPVQQELFQKNPRYIGLKFPEISKLETLEKRYLKIDSFALDFMQKLLKMEPLERMTANEALLHPYLNDSYERPQTNASMSRADSAGTRGRQQQGIINQRNKRGYLMSNPIIENKKTIKNKEDSSLSPTLQIKETQHVIASEGLKNNKSTTNKDNLAVKFRVSPFVNEITSEGRLDRQKSKEGIKYNDNIVEARGMRKKKSALEENQMFNINEEENSKVSPRLKPVSIKKKTTKVLYPQEAPYENHQLKNLRSGIFNRVLPKPAIEQCIDNEELSNHQSARQLPNIYGHFHPEQKRGRQKEEDPDLGGGPQYLVSFQPEDHMHPRQNKGHNFGYK